MQVPLWKFLTGWAPMLAVSASVDPTPRLADAFVMHLGGVAVPSVTCLLGALGIALARPLARNKESALHWSAFVIVSAILLITVEIWIIDSKPAALFAFVVAIGLGFSGYSLIELVGAELADFVKRVIPGVAAAAAPPVVPTSPIPSPTPEISSEEPKS